MEDEPITVGYSETTIEFDEPDDVTVGFGGKRAPLLGRLFPRLTDRLMEAVGYWAQQTSAPGLAPRRDNLYS